MLRPSALMRAPLPSFSRNNCRQNSKPLPVSAFPPSICTRRPYNVSDMKFAKSVCSSSATWNAFSPLPMGCSMRAALWKEEGASSMDSMTVLHFGVPPHKWSIILFFQLFHFAGSLSKAFNLSFFFDFFYGKQSGFGIQSVKNCFYQE